MLASLNALIKIGAEEIDAIVRDLDDDQAIILMLIPMSKENTFLQRRKDMLIRYD